MEARRDRYLNELIDNRDNGLIKVITGLRGCGKTYLLFRQYGDYLMSSGVAEGDIIRIRLEDPAFAGIRRPESLCGYISKKLDGHRHGYVMVSEFHLLGNAGRAMSLLAVAGDIDIYVTDSFATKFRNLPPELSERMYMMRMYPLSFSEYMTCNQGSVRLAWNEYLRYGGMPALIGVTGESQKENYLTKQIRVRLMEGMNEVFGIRKAKALAQTTEILYSHLGRPTNYTAIMAIFLERYGEKVGRRAVTHYMSALQDSGIIEAVNRYDVKRKRPLKATYKYFPLDMGLCNAVTGFSDLNETGLALAAIYLELRYKGYHVDLGMAVSRKMVDGKLTFNTMDMDFAVQLVDTCCCIQYVHTLDDTEELESKKDVLRLMRRGFRKFILTSDNVTPYVDEDGNKVICVTQFLLDPDCLRNTD